MNQVMLPVDGCTRVSTMNRMGKHAFQWSPPQNSLQKLLS